MKKTGGRLKSIIRYITTVLSWSLFVMLMGIAAFLFYYFISLKIYETKGYDYRPALTIYTIVSPSMVPTIDVYDIVINKRVEKPEDIKVDDIITFISQSSISKGLTVTHRVANKYQKDGVYYFETKGDNNISKDTMPTTFSDIIGKAVMRLPQFGRIQFFLASGTGWILVVVIPSLFVIIKDVIKLVKVSNMRKMARMENINMVLKEDKKAAAILEEMESPIIIKKE